MKLGTNKAAAGHVQILITITRPTVFIRPFEKRSYYVIPLGVRPSVRPSVRLL